MLAEWVSVHSAALDKGQMIFQSEVTQYNVTNLTQ